MKTATVSTYKLFAANGRYIRQATKVTLPDGREIKFTERLTKREALAAVAGARRG
jgi:hypothetical protein